jgi:hypothetical protein
MSGTSINWDNDDLLRLVGRVSGDACPDILGFALDDAWTAINQGDGGFAQATRAPWPT